MAASELPIDHREGFLCAGIMSCNQRRLSLLVESSYSSRMSVIPTTWCRNWVVGWKSVDTLVPLRFGQNSTCLSMTELFPVLSYAAGSRRGFFKLTFSMVGCPKRKPLRGLLSKNYLSASPRMSGSSVEVLVLRRTHLTLSYFRRRRPRLTTQ